MLYWKDLLSLKDRGREAAELALAIAKAYGFVLEKSLNVVEQEAALIIPKDAIKLSLLALHAMAENDAKRKFLETSYSFLAFFQPMNDSETAAVHSLSRNVSSDLRQTPNQLKAELSKFYANFPVLKELLDRVLTEQESLLSEIRSIADRR